MGGEETVTKSQDVTPSYLPHDYCAGRMQKKVSWGCWRGRKQVDLESQSWVHPTIRGLSNPMRGSLSKKWGSMTEET